MTAPDRLPIPVQDAEQIDLRRHAVIEASAGTGKTHTIKDLVVALLRDNDDLSLDEILIVTFTEKATGELKEKIRQNIQTSIQKEWSETLQASLDNFDTSSIFTIHGFCNKLLQEYAFENGTQFRNELIDDRVIYRKALVSIMREEWPARYGSDLPAVLCLSGFPGSTGSGFSSWMDRVIEVALKYQPSCDDMLEPSGDPDLLGRMHNMEDSCRAFLDELISLVGSIDEQNIALSELCSRYSRLNIRKNSMNKRQRILVAILNLIRIHRQSRASLSEISDFFILMHDELGEKGFNDLNDGWIQRVQNFQEHLPKLPAIIEILERFRALDLSSLQNLLASLTVMDIKRVASEMKKNRSLLSYDDMLSQVCTALDASSTLREVLQRRYRYALIDEFQDTDLLQWKIFKTIFLDSGNNRLFIIGDPKQAIYGFRGADVNAYFIARDEMIASYRAEYYCLTENWRSSPGLINSFNTLFGNDSWFTSSNIRYVPVAYPREKEPNLSPPVQSLRVVRLGTCSGTEAKFRAADFIARELKRIIAENPSIDRSKIAILVTKWKEAAVLEKSLKKLSIQYSYYKKEGLYQTREALELLCLLTAIARPNDLIARKKALLTRFFNVPVQSMGDFDSIPAGHPSSILFERWALYAEERNWPHMFQSIMEETGILYRDEIENRDRTLLNFRSIIQNLEIESIRNNLCIQEIADYLSVLKNQTASSHESYNIQKIDAGMPGVQLMTIHASKGLEFNIVFIAGGFSYQDKSDFWTYHRGKRRIFDLARDPSVRMLYDAETAGETERLFYVALTRAKNLLYIPTFEPTSRSKSGMLGNKLPQILNAIRGDENMAWIDIPSETSEPAVYPERARHQVSLPVIPEPLFPDPSLQFLERTISLESFSGLKQKMFIRNALQQDFRQYGHGGPKSGEDDTGVSAGLKPQALGLITELPRSLETGLMLHEILERVDFHLVGRTTDPEELIARGSETARLINESIGRYMNYPDQDEITVFRKEAARMVWNAVHAPLDKTGLSLRMCDAKIHEVEFYFPAGPFSDQTIPDVYKKQGFLHGFIDLVFRAGEKYYIVDWKSNYIEGGYAPRLLADNITAMHYDLQILIYSAALIRWLKRMEQNYAYNRHFGGVYYLYLRGIDPETPGNGIYFHRESLEIDIIDNSSIPK